MLTETEILKSLVLFLLNKVDVTTKETSLELYERWQEYSRIKIRNPHRAAWILDYLETQKNFSREDIKEAARLDNFIGG